MINFHFNCKAATHRPVKAAKHHRFPTGAGDSHGELLLCLVAAVVEGLQDVSLSAVGHHLLVTAPHHDAVCTPG